MDGRNRGLTLVELVIIVVVVVVLANLLLPSIGGPHGRGSVVRCMHNLSQLWKMENIYTTQFGGPGKAMPVETGKAFWLKLREVKLLDDQAAELFRCPVLEKDSPDCQYRGPGASVATLKDDAIVGADDIQNHGGEGGNVLRKSGDIQEIPDQAEFEVLTRDLK